MLMQSTTLLDVNVSATAVCSCRVPRELPTCIKCRGGTGRDRETERDGQTDIQRQTDRQADKGTEGDRQTDRDRQRQTDRQTSDLRTLLLKD